MSFVLENVDWGLVERAEGDCAGAAHAAVESAESLGCRSDETRRGIRRQVEAKRGGLIDGDVVEIAAVAPCEGEARAAPCESVEEGRPAPPEAPTTRMHAPEGDLLLVEEAFIVPARVSWPGSRERCR